MKLCIHICSEDEWKETVSALKVKKSKLRRQPYGEFFDHSFGKTKCIIYNSGATKTRASGACQYAIDTWRPYAVINLGTCAGVSDNIRKLDIIIATKTFQYDVIQRFGKPSPLFFETMITDLDTSWVNISLVPEKIHKGTIATADQDLNYENRKKLQKENENILGADWESASIAKVCELNKVKCLILRGVTDIPESRARSKDDLQDRDYNKNTQIIMKKLLSVINKIRFR